MKDITDRKVAEEALRDAEINFKSKSRAERTAQLLAKSKELENFCYSVSHDLKALSADNSYSRLLLESYHERLDEEGRSFLQNVRAATRHMTRLIEDFLAYSKLERRKLSTMSVELSSFVTNLLLQFRDSLQNVHLTVKETPIESGRTRMASP